MCVAPALLCLQPTVDSTHRHTHTAFIPRTTGAEMQYLQQVDGREGEGSPLAIANRTKDEGSHVFRCISPPMDVLSIARCCVTVCPRIFVFEDIRVEIIVAEKT